jgi:hypothetical protein
MFDDTFTDAAKIRSYFLYWDLFGIAEAATDTEEHDFHHELLLGDLDVKNWPGLPEWHRQMLEDVRAVLHSDTNG